jgi:Tol biopolymer transport system component
MKRVGLKKFIFFVFIFLTVTGVVGFALPIYLAPPINHGTLGVVDTSIVDNILQITTGTPETPTAKDWIPCWGVNPWSYDGQWVVYHSQIGGGSSNQRNEICIVKADGTGFQRLTNNSECDTHGNFTPDGTKIIFQRDVVTDKSSEDHAEIWIMNRDGSNQHSLTQAHGGPVIPGGCEQKAMVSLDGKKIAFRACTGSSSDDESGQLWVMNIDGTNPIKVSGALTKNTKHSWSPDSKWILFSSEIGYGPTTPTIAAKKVANTITSYKAGGDTIPDQFTFVDQSLVGDHDWISSNPITVSGINAPTGISITSVKNDGGNYYYNINDGGWQKTGTVNNGDIVKVFLYSGDGGSIYDATVTIGGVSDTFNITTAVVSASRIFKVRPNGADLTMLSEDVADVACENWAAWSPSGDMISYHRRGNDSNDFSELWIMNTDGTEKQVLVSAIPDGEVDDEWVCGPHSWNPFSTHIVFKKNLDHSPLFIINVNTREISQLTDGYPDGRMWWGPDGKKILFHEYTSSGTTSGTSRDGGLYSSDLLVLNLAKPEFEFDVNAFLASLGLLNDLISDDDDDSPGKTVTTSSSNKNCFIATAAFGSPLAGQVEILRQFRDKYLLTNALGQKFVAWYYNNGPIAANWIKDKPLAKVAVQAALYPLIGFSFLLIGGYMPFVTAGFLLSTLLFLRYRPKKIIDI